MENTGSPPRFGITLLAASVRAPSTTLIISGFVTVFFAIFLRSILPSSLYIARLTTARTLNMAIMNADSIPTIAVAFVPPRVSARTIPIIA